MLKMLPIAIALVMIPPFLVERANAIPLAAHGLSTLAPASDAQPVYWRGGYRGGWRVGGRYYGGVWYGHVRRWYGGRWWPYGVGSCWAPSPIGFVWICG